MTSGDLRAAALNSYVNTATSANHRLRLPRRAMVSRLALRPLPSAVRCARLHAKLVLREWNLAHVGEDAELIVSELATNALHASRSLSDDQPIVLHLQASHERLTIQVWDALPAAPHPQPHAIDAETGRGLEIVSILSDRWGFYRPRTGGKLVWAILELKTLPDSADESR